MSLSLANSTVALCPLASGSKGNSYYLEADGTSILVDVGISLRQLSLRLEAVDREANQIEHVFITHEHGDHVRGLEMLMKKCDPTLWASRGTLRKLRKHIPDHAKVRLIENEVETIGEIQVRAIPVSHDAAQPLAYRFDAPGGSAAIMTDLGTWDAAIAKAVHGVDLMVCEANYDPQMLRSGPYPQYLKHRISSVNGHLCNEDGAKLAASASNGQVEMQVVLGHLSEQNNSSGLALDTFTTYFEQVGKAANLVAARQDAPGPWLEVGK